MVFIDLKGSLVVKTAASGVSSVFGSVAQSCLTVCDPTDGSTPGSLSFTIPWRRELLPMPWTEEPGRLQSMGSHGVGHDLETNLPPPSYFPMKL